MSGRCESAVGGIRETDLEDVPACAMCGSREVLRSVPRRVGLTVRECGGCGYAYVSPRPNRRAMGEHYQREYVGGDLAEVWRDHRAFDVLGGDVRRIARHARIEGSAVLDVGCGAGFMLDALRRRGARTLVGIEPSAAGAAFASGALPGATILHSFYEDANLADRTFDVITGLDIIEHFYDPAGFVRWARQRLTAGAILYLRTPNWGAVSRYGESWEGLWRDFEHLQYFDARTLPSLLAANGLRVVELTYEGFRSGMGSEEHEGHAPADQRRALRTVRSVLRSIPILNAQAYRALEMLRYRRARDDIRSGWSANLIVVAEVV